MDLSETKYDIASAAESGIAIEIFDPDGNIEMHDGKPVTITVRGQDSPTVQKIFRTQQARNTHARKVDSEADGYAILAAATSDWYGFVMGPDILECNDKNVIAAYRKMPWIGDQVLAFMRERSNFFTG